MSERGSTGEHSASEPDGRASNPVMRALRVAVPDAVRRRLALKFVVALLVMALLIGLVGFVATDRITTETETRIQEEYRSLAVQEANLVGKQVEQARTATKLASRDAVWTSDNATLIRNELRTVLSETSTATTSVASIRVYEVEGGSYRTVADTVGTNETLEDVRREWVADESFDDPTDVGVSSVYRTPAGPVMGVVSPVAGSDRYLLAEFSISTLAVQFQGSDRAEGGFTQIVNGSGTVLIDEQEATAGVASSEVLGAYGDETVLRRATGLTRNTSGVVANRPASDVLNRSYVVGFAAVEARGVDGEWYALVHAPRAEVFGFANTVEEYGRLATGGAALLIVLVGAVWGASTSRSIDRLREKAEAMEEGDLDVEIHSPRIDSIGQLYDGFASMRDALREQLAESERARKEAEVARAEAEEMNEYLQSTAEAYSETLAACARGDLTQRMDPDGENDAMDRIAADFNEMIAELEMTTGQLESFAAEVEESGESVRESAGAVRDASEQVAESVQRISDDAYDQRERLQGIAERVDEAVATLESSADADPDAEFAAALDDVRAVAETVERTADLAEETMAESETVAGAAEEQAAELTEVSAQAEELTRYARYLGDGLGNFNTENEHEFVFRTGAGATVTEERPPGAAESDGPGDGAATGSDDDGSGGASGNGNGNSGLSDDRSD